MQLTLYANERKRMTPFPICDMFLRSAGALISCMWASGISGPFLPPVQLRDL